MDTISIRLKYAQETLDELINALESLTQALREQVFPALTSHRDFSQEVTSLVSQIRPLQELIKEFAADIALARESHAEEEVFSRPSPPDLRGCPFHVNHVLINDIRNGIAWTLVAGACARDIRRRTGEVKVLRSREVKVLLRRVANLFAMPGELRSDSKTIAEAIKGKTAVELIHETTSLSAA